MIHFFCITYHIRQYPHIADDVCDSKVQRFGVSAHQHGQIRGMHHKTDIGVPTWVIMQVLLLLFMNLIIVGMRRRHAESVHRVVMQMIGWINIIL